jgi:1,2-phenylacetyl-CoA epoxidase PaaB subunit
MVSCIVCKQSCTTASTVFTCQHRLHDRCALERIYQGALTCPACRAGHHSSVAQPMSRNVYQRLQHVVQQWSQLKKRQQAMVTQEMESLHDQLKTISAQSSAVYHQREVCQETIQILTEEERVLFNTAQAWVPIRIPKSSMHQARLDTMSTHIEHMKEALGVAEMDYYRMKKAVEHQRAHKCTSLLPQPDDCRPMSTVVCKSTEQLQLEGTLHFLQRVQRRGRRRITRFYPQGCQACGFEQYTPVKGTRLSLCTACYNYFCQPMDSSRSTEPTCVALNMRDQYILSCLGIPTPLNSE